MESQKKILTRIRLINWHFFENETVALNGSTLISGENTAGKSTILDAIQLVLTTNTRRFNMAANENSKRSLMGYVRCKVGKIGETYLRSNAVPANVALEFYEEKGDRYFVLGVHMLSSDEESPVITKWYMEECRLENLSFIIDGRPALSQEFKCNGNKISFIEQKNAAKERFKRRLGNLDDKFFDIIPKSLAFKPMDNVKEFINRFVLPEGIIDVETLRTNVETLNELEELLVRTHRQYEDLSTILTLSDDIERKTQDILVNDIMISIAETDALKEDTGNKLKTINLMSLAVESGKEQLDNCDRRINAIDEQILGISIAIESNSSNKLLEDLKRRIRELEAELDRAEDGKKLLIDQVEFLKNYCRELRSISYDLLDKDELNKIVSDTVDEKDKNALMERLDRFKNTEAEAIRKEYYRLLNAMESVSGQIEELTARLKQLEKHKLSYPANTELLRDAIKAEFKKRAITSEVYILAELLEITDHKWTDAIEGYLHIQKFYLIVEPEYYDIAIDVYDRLRNKIHSAGIINTKRLPMHKAEVDVQVEGDNSVTDTLADVIYSENRYAKAYADYILGRVVRCDSVKELENYDIAITPQCMLYQGYVLRHLDPSRYREPYIGKNAFMSQISIIRSELENKSAERSSLRERISLYQQVIEAENKIDLTIMRQNLHTPERLAELDSILTAERVELDKAGKDPTLIQLQFDLDEKNKQKTEHKAERNRLAEENARLSNQIDNLRTQLEEMKKLTEDNERNLAKVQDDESVAYADAVAKYSQNRKGKSARVIADNFAPRRVQYERERSELIDHIKALQMKFNTDYTADFTIGMNEIGEYREAQHKLKSVEMIQYEERLRKAKDDCEEIFRSDFLSKMKELIENARMEFRNLNKALKGIYYGEDSYEFKIAPNKGKEALYKMITSENNMEGENLWTVAFEAQYKEEMTDLFDKLTTKDDNGEKIVDEYTDYRSYLDYEIEIHKKDGSIQRFSDIYGEKSGSETQVPYYVAIAASFYQLYRYGNSIRIMLMDEAFDKMDDERVEAMMNLFNELDLQVILATPPPKIEVIGEHVGTVLTAIRAGESSIVEEYDL